MWPEGVAVGWPSDDVITDALVWAVCFPFFIGTKKPTRKAGLKLQGTVSEKEKKRAVGTSQAPDGLMLSCPTGQRFE
ncbi:MAG: hypothetical protein JWP57_1118 [Spirosoma sp.]|nr:hypothetical protein [Spirosoma sp.]